MLIAKVTRFDVPPPGVGLKTPTCAVPAVWMSVLGMPACNSVLFTNAVFRFPPFQVTVDPLTKLVPLTVRVNPCPPARPLEGRREMTVGTGLVWELMVKVAALEVPPPGGPVRTVTAAVPGNAMSMGLMVACNCVSLTKKVVRGPPFHSITDPETKLRPVTTNVKPADPASMLLGEIELIEGAGLVTVLPHPASVRTAVSMTSPETASLPVLTLDASSCHSLRLPLPRGEIRGIATPAEFIKIA